MTRTIAIAVHAFKESVREKVLYSLVLFAILLIAAGVLFGSISVGVNEIVLINLGLTAISVLGLVIAIFIGISLVSKEIERRTIYNVLSRPVRRWEFIIGKYLGLILTLLVNTAIMTGAFYVILWWQKRRLGTEDVAPLEAIYFILLQLALVVALALLFSTISTPVLSAVLSFTLYVIGNSLGDLREFGDDSGSAIVKLLSRGLALILPDFSAFSAIAGAAHGRLIPGYRLLSNSLYALLYVTVLVSGAILIFEEREF
jgi:ABC-type transport system involved in multi-copper enzyme maturation permease subunit